MITVQIYKARDGWRWRMKRSGRVIAESGEAYTRKSSLKRTLTNLIEGLSTAFNIEELN